MSVTKSKLKLWDYKCAYQLCYLCVHDKSANAGTTLFGGFDVDHSKTPHLNQGAEYGSRDWLSLFLSVIQNYTIVQVDGNVCLIERIGLVATCLSQ